MDLIRIAVRIAGPAIMAAIISYFSYWGVPLCLIGIYPCLGIWMLMEHFDPFIIVEVKK